MQGCGVGVETGVGVGRSRPFSPESESELESVKFGRLRLRPVVAVYCTSTDDDFDRTVIHPYENIERQEEKENGSVQIKPKRHLVIVFRLIKVSELMLDHRDQRLGQCIQRLACRPHSKESAIMTTACIPSWREWRIYWCITRSDTVKSEIKKIAASYCSS